MDKIYLIIFPESENKKLTEFKKQLILFDVKVYTIAFNINIH